MPSLLRRLTVLAVLALPAAPAGAKTLVFCSEGDPKSLNPQLVTDTTGMNAGRPMFNNLVEFAPGSLDPKPGLAERWDISADGLSYTFHLRDGVRFHANDLFTPTRTLNADDVLFSFDRQSKPDHPYHSVGGARYDYFQDIGLPERLVGVEKLDNRTVRFRIRQPDATFLPTLTMPLAMIQSAEYAEALLRDGRPELFDTRPVGTGPFAFNGYQKDVLVRFRAFPDHWAGAPPIDTLVFSITPNAAVRLTKLKAGECHVMAFPNPADIARIEADPSLRLMRQEGFNIGFMALNVLKAPFDDVRVRRAINMAVDRQAIVDAVYGRAGTVATNPFPPMLWSFNADVRDYPYDPDGARRLMAEAGHPAGFETELWYLPVTRPYNPNGKRVAEMIAADLLRVGIRAELKTTDWASYRRVLQTGEAPMSLFGWTGDIGDPDNFLNVLLGCTSARTGGNNVGKWCDPAFDALIGEAQRLTDRAAREPLYREAQAIAKREAPWVPLAHSLVYMAVRKEVQGYRMDLLGRQAFEGVDLSP